MDYLTWPMKVTGKYDLSYLKLIANMKNNDRCFLFDLSGSNYFPHDGSEKLNDSDTLFHLFNSQIKGKVFYISSDVSLFENINLYENVNNEIEFLIYPWFFLTQCMAFYTFEEFKPLYNQFDNLEKKYKIILLCRNRKLHKFQLINELKNVEGFIYSNVGFYSGEKRDSELLSQKPTSTIIDVELLENSEYVRCLYDSGFEKDVIPSEPIVEQFHGRNFNSNHIQNLTEIPIEQVIDCLTKLGCFIEKEKHQEGLNHWFCVPKEYRESYIEIITESNTFLGNIFSEKIFKSIYFEKMFIVLGSKNIHAKLEKYGFKLFRNVFDYKFDDKTYDERFSSIISQSKHLCKLSLQELDQIYQTNIEIIKHNKQVALNIIERDFHDKISNIVYEKQGSRGTFWEILNEAKTRIVKRTDSKTLDNFLKDRTCLNR